MILIFSIAMLLSGGDGSVSLPRCERDGHTFYLSGRIDPELSACVQANFAADVSEIVVDSQGGDADQSLLIAEHVEGSRFTLRVRGQCSSGCANLLLPLAERVIVEPGSYILLHGSLDPQQLEREIIRPRQRLISRALRENPHLRRDEVETNYDAATSQTRRLMDRLTVFAARNRIHPGWLFYREAHDRGLGRHVAGRLQGREPTFVLVEEPLIRSCLPHVQVEPFQAGLEASFIENSERFGRFRSSGNMRPMDLVCVSKRD